ncbi:MAG: hypothetical protein WCA82_10700 [Jiangellales bacterium]
MSTSTPQLSRRTASALRDVADEVTAWSHTHEAPPVADKAANLARRTAARVEDDPVRLVAYEAERHARERPWVLPVTVVATTALVVGVALLVRSRRRRATDSDQH